MLRHLALFLTSACTRASSLAAPPAGTTPKTLVWPLVRSLSLSGGAGLPIAPFIDIAYNGSSAVVRAAIERYSPIIRRSAKPVGSPESVQLIRVSLTGESEALSIETSYNHTISVAGSVALITADSPYGVSYALESFAQLSHSGSLPARSVVLADGPEHAHRGLMIDTGRRFWPVPLVKSVLDAMAYSKMSVLRFHASDYCRWAVESKEFPALTRRLTGEQAGHYSQDDVRELIEYARLRGIRVVPDFDMPGHSTGIIAALGGGEIVSCPARDKAWPFEVLFDDPARKTAGTLKTLLTEMAGLFPDAYFSLGMDETCSPHNCTYNPPCSFNNTVAFERDMLDHVVSLQKVPVCFDEALFMQRSAPPSAAVIAWQAQTPHQVAAKGHAVIENSGSSFYLNDLWLTAADTWRDISNPAERPPRGRQPDDPMPASLRHLLLGGEVAMWSDNYCYAAQCHPGATSGGAPMKAPVAAALYPPTADAAFAASIAGMLWPRGAAAAGAFYRYDAALQGDRFDGAIQAFNDNVLRDRGIGSCPTGCACDELSMCGTPYLPR
jgi:hexosaminidase